MKTQLPSPARRDAAARGSAPATRSPEGSQGTAISGSPRMRTQSEALAASFGTAAQRRNGPDMQGHASAPGQGVIQAQWDTLAMLLTGVATGIVTALVTAYWWWPRGWSLAQLRALYQYIDLHNILAFAALPWNPASVIALGQAYAAQPNGMTPTQWITIAQALPANATADAAAFAQMAGWNHAQILQLVGDFVAYPGAPPSAARWSAVAVQLLPASRPLIGPFAELPWTVLSVIALGQAYLAQANGLTPAEWAAIAQALPANADADATALAQTAGAWNGAQLAQLAADFAAYAGPAPVAARWAVVAALLPPASRPIVGMLSAPAAPPLTPLQIARGQAIFVASGHNAQRVAAWIARGARGQIAPLAPIPRAAGPLGLPGGALGPLPAPYALDAVLGPGSHLALRAQILLHGRPYAPNPFVRQHAQALVAAGMTAANTLTLLTSLCNNMATAGDFNRAVAVATAMHQNNVAFAETQNFIVNHPAVAGPAAMLPAIQDLTARPGVTALLLNQILTALAPMGHPALFNFLTTRLPDTPGLTLARLADRVDHLVLPGAPHLGLAPGAIDANQFQGLDNSLTQRVNNGTLSPGARGRLEAAYSLLAEANQANMLAFIGSAAVAGTLNNAPATNAAYWLHQFALRHVGAPPGGFAAQNVVVMAGGAARTITIDNAIIQHVLQRHSYEHFRLIAPIINRHPTSAMFIAGQNPMSVAASLTATLNSGAFTGQYPWPVGVDIQVGAVQLRLVHLGGANYRVSQYFIQVAPGLAHDVTQGVLHQIANRFPWLVY